MARLINLIQWMKQHLPTNTEPTRRSMVVISGQISGLRRGASGSPNIFQAQEQACQYVSVLFSMRLFLVHTNLGLLTFDELIVPSLVPVAGVQALSHVLSSECISVPGLFLQRVFNHMASLRLFLAKNWRRKNKNEDKFRSGQTPYNYIQEERHPFRKSLLRCL